MSAIDNANLKNYRSNERDGFVPKVTFEYDAVEKEIDFDDASTIPAGKTLKKIIIKVHDKKGGEARGYILPVAGGDSGHDGDTTIDVSELDVSKPLDITATVILSDGLVADGGAYDIGAVGELGSWDIQKNAQ